MKITYLFKILLILLSSYSIGQTKIDGNVSVFIPGNVIEEKRDSNNLDKKIFYSKTDNESFIVQRDLSVNIGKEFNSNTNNFEIQKKVYDKIVKGSVNEMKSNGYLFINSQKTSIDNHLGISAIFRKENNDSSRVQFNFLVIGKFIYTFTYFNDIKYNEANLNSFFNSIQ